MSGQAVLRYLRALTAAEEEGEREEESYFWSRQYYFRLRETVFRTGEDPNRILLSETRAECVSHTSATSSTPPASSM